MRIRQKSLFDYYNLKPLKRRYGRLTHGGDLNVGKRKLERPLDSRSWVHLTLKSDRAKGAYNMLNARHRVKIERLIYSKAEKFGVKIAEYINMGNHLHIRCRIRGRRGFQNFLRSVTTMIARLVTGARRGHKFGRFWQGLAFTRILKSALELKQLVGYFEANRRELAGGRVARQVYLDGVNGWIASLKRQAMESG